MNTDYINISNIETFLDSLIRKNVCTNTFVGTLPDTTDNRWNQMVLIDCGNAIADMNAYGSGIVLVYLFAKPMANGTKNVKVLSTMETKLNKAILGASDSHYMINRRASFNDFDSVRKWHCNVIELRLTIV